MSNVFVTITMSLLCVSNLLQNIISRKLRKEIENLEHKMARLEIEMNNIKTDVNIKTKELANWISWIS